MRRSRTLLALAAFAALLSVTHVAHATVVVPLSLSQQVERADLIVRARIGTHRSAFVPERGAILTWTDLEITEVLKGQASASLTLRQMGGTADGQTMLVPGDAHFQGGEDAILFLRRDPSDDGTVFLVALAQSAWVVSGARASRDLSQLTFAVLGQDGMQLEESGREPSIRLDALLSDIRSLVGGAR